MRGRGRKKKLCAKVIRQEDCKENGSPDGPWPGSKITGDESVGPEKVLGGWSGTNLAL